MFRQCEAKSKRTGEQCKARAMREKGVCYHHGGKSPGAPAGSSNAATHGAYGTLIRERLSENERASFDAVSVEPSLADELRILRFKLLSLIGEVDQNVHGKDTTWKVKADDLEKGRGIAYLAGEIRKLVKEMKDIGGEDPLLDLVDAWKKGMDSEDASPGGEESREEPRPLSEAGDVPKD